MALANDLFQELIQTFMEIAQALIAPAPTARARDNTSRFFKLWNPNLYYSNLYMEYYYFC